MHDVQDKTLIVGHMERNMKTVKRFDWYTAIVKKALGQTIFDIGGVSASLWLSGEIAQGEDFQVRLLLGNQWNCAVDVTIEPDVKPLVLFKKKDEARKLVMPRVWQVSLGANEIMLATVHAHAQADCKKITLAFEKAKTKRKGKGQRTQKRRGSRMGSAATLLDVLLLPFGYLTIRTPAMLGLQIQERVCEHAHGPTDQTIKPLDSQVIWKTESPEQVHLAPLVHALWNEPSGESGVALKNDIETQYTAWADKHALSRKVDIQL
jgi:hypothetical protein